MPPSFPAVAGAMIALSVVATTSSAQAGRTVASDTIAVVDVTVLPMASSAVLAHQTLIAANGRVLEMGPVASVRVPASSRRIDGRGKFLLPGLADMHVHLTTVDELPMYIGYGVLTVRDLNGSPQTLDWRSATASGRLLGPRIFASGPMLAGGDIPWKNKVIPKSADEARAAVLAQKAAGLRSDQAL